MWEIFIAQGYLLPLFITTLLIDNKHFKDSPTNPTTIFDQMNENGENYKQSVFKYKILYKQLIQILFTCLLRKYVHEG